MSVHSNISIFVPHVGCPHKCAFCDQRTITGEQKLPHSADVKNACEQALSQVKDISNTEIAFFGGSFTAIPREYMLELLSAASEYVGDGKFAGIRLSTRPDYIDREVLDILKKHGVTAIELGAQSMSDKVLELNGRGHTARDVINACGLIREYGFELGLQMMIGLYKSTPEDENETFRAVMDIRPDTVRIYPTVILKNTRLAQLYLDGEYETMDFDGVVEHSAACMEAFHKAGISVIKCGLHASEFVEKDMVGGFYHPAFRELCEGLIYRHAMERTLGRMFVHEASFAVAKGCMSKAVGHGKSNKEYFRQRGVQIHITEDEGTELYEVKLLGVE